MGRAAVSQRDFYLCAPPVSEVGERGQPAGISEKMAKNTRKERQKSCG